MKRRGSILILVMFVVAALSLVATSFAYRAGSASRLARDVAIKAQLKAQADSAIAIAVNRLKQNTNDFDHPAEPWCRHEPLSRQTWLPEWAEGAIGAERSFVANYEVIDEEGKLDLAYASSDALQHLGMTSVQISSLFDWADADEDAQAQGAESGYYAALGYHSKNKPLDSIRELASIRGFDAAGIWGSQFLMDALGGETGGELVPGWVNFVTCGGDGRLNLNTAPLAVLQTLPLSSGAAEQIDRFRRFDFEIGTEGLHEHAFKAVEDIEQLQGLTPSDRAVLEGLAVFKSKRFRIVATSGNTRTGMTHRTAVLVTVEEKKIAVAEWTNIR